MSLTEDYLQKLSESHRLMFQTLLQEAEDRGRFWLSKGQKIADAVNYVSDTMLLNQVESDELTERLMKPGPISTPPAPPQVEQAEDVDRLNVIYFEDTAQQNDAIQILMDRSIDWTEKSLDNNRPFVQFVDESKLEEAQSALRRKWDFVENRKRLVADLRFDNLMDYTRVLEYMRRQGMLVEYGNEIELDEDYDEAQSRVVKDKKLAEKEGRLFNESVSVNSFRAKSRRLNTKELIDPIKETRFRAAHTRKRWI